MPEACHNFGYIEMGVKPGMVLISLHKNPRPGLPSLRRSS